MLYLYGVTRADREQPKLEGLGSPPAAVRLIESGPVAAAVTELPDDYVVEEEDARAHLQVLIGLLEAGPVLPLRMGTVAPGEEAVRSEVLDVAQPTLVSKLDAIDGMVELHVDVEDDESQSIAEIARSAGVPVGPSADLESRIELGQEIADLLVARRQRVADEIVSELRPLAVQDTARSVIRSAEDPVLRWAFLVARDEMDRFDQAVAKLRAEHPTLAISYFGPLPPSHFIEWQSESEAVSEADSFHAQGAWGW